MLCLKCIKKSIYSVSIRRMKPFLLGMFCDGDIFQSAQPGAKVTGLEKDNLAETVML